MGGVRDLPWSVAPDGIIIEVRLTPRGGRDAIDGIERRSDGRAVLKARVRAAAQDGEANAALCRLLAEAVGTAPRQVTLVAGASARLKRIRILGEATSHVAALTRLLDARAKLST